MGGFLRHYAYYPQNLATGVSREANHRLETLGHHTGVGLGVGQIVICHLVLALFQGFAGQILLDGKQIGPVVVVSPSGGNQTQEFPGVITVRSVARSVSLSLVRARRTPLHFSSKLQF